MDELNDAIEPDSGQALPPEPAPEITSRFLFVDVAALRAKQLRRGARARFPEGEAPAAVHKAERLAMEEVRRGLVYYDVPASGQGTDDKGGELSSGAGSPRGYARDEG